MNTGGVEGVFMKFRASLLVGSREGKYEKNTEPAIKARV